jgi:hypothetical protein
MMDKDIFKERERSLEEGYFRQHEAKLIEKLRERAKVDEIVEALAVKLQTDDPAAAFLLAPLVQVAWAEGAVTDREREKVLRIATERGIDPSSPAYTQLQEWLRTRPADAVFDTAIETIKTGLSVLTPAERADRVKRIVNTCREVASTSGGLGRLLGLGTGVSSEEESILDAMAATLRAR